MMCLKISSYEERVNVVRKGNHLVFFESGHDLKQEFVFISVFFLVIIVLPWILQPTSLGENIAVSIVALIILSTLIAVFLRREWFIIDENGITACRVFGDRCRHLAWKDCQFVGLGSFWRSRALVCSVVPLPPGERYWGACRAISRKATKAISDSRNILFGGVPVNEGDVEKIIFLWEQQARTE